MTGKKYINTALVLMLALLGGILVRFYLLPGRNGPGSLFATVLTGIVFFGLAVSMTVCTLLRVSARFREPRGTRFNVAVWGSVIFHTGMVVILFGFAVSSLFGMRGSVMIPEGVAIKFPADMESMEKGRLHVFEEYTVGLKKLELVREGNNVGQVRSDLDFFTGTFPNRRVMEINRPVKFMGYYWRSMNWGYSVRLQVKKQGKLVLDDFLNIATHRDGVYYDRFSIPDLGEWEVRFYPDISPGGRPVQNEVFPVKPATGIKISGQQDGKNIIRQGQSKKVGKFEVKFVEHRFWEKFDVSSDPGEIFIYLGSILAVAGLFFRVFFSRR